MKDKKQKKKNRKKKKKKVQEIQLKQVSEEESKSDEIKNTYEIEETSNASGILREILTKYGQDNDIQDQQYIDNELKQIRHSFLTS